jgi:predicted metal-dependent TIM-barrel fold hydrolase
VADILSPFLEAPECLGIGEIGLETGTEREREILCAQIEFGLSSGLSHIRFGIHTPRMQKEAVTRQLLSLLDPYESLAPASVIDHCTHGIIEEILDRGYHAGISLSPNKSSEGELLKMLKRFGSMAHRIMCNTDSSRDFYEDLVQAAQSWNIEESIAQKIFSDTAADFFGIKDR